MSLAPWPSVSGAGSTGIPWDSWETEGESGLSAGFRRLSLPICSKNLNTGLGHYLTARGGSTFSSSPELFCRDLGQKVRLSALLS